MTNDVLESRCSMKMANIWGILFKSCKLLSFVMLKLTQIIFFHPFFYNSYLFIYLFIYLLVPTIEIEKSNIFTGLQNINNFVKEDLFFKILNIF